MAPNIRVTSFSLLLIFLLVLTASPVNAGKLRKGWQRAKKDAQRKLKEAYDKIVEGQTTTQDKRDALERVGLGYNQKSLSDYFIFDKDLGPNLDRFEDIVFQRGFYTTLLKKEDMLPPRSIEEMAEDKDSDAHHAFTAFCEENQILEAWLFYVETQDLTARDRRKIRDIYFKYIQEGSEYQINISYGYQVSWTLAVYKRYPKKFSSAEETTIKERIIERFLDRDEKRKINQRKKISMEKLRRKIKVDMKDLIKNTRKAAVKLLKRDRRFENFKKQYGQLIRTHVFDVARGKIRRALENYQEQINTKSAKWKRRNLTPQFWLPIENTLKKLDNVVEYFAKKVKSGGKVPAKKWLRAGKKFKKDMRDLERALQQKLK